MPTIATFGAGSARGFGAGELRRFIYEYIGATSVASIGTTWNGTENFAYFSFGGGDSTASEIFTSITFNGTIGFLNNGDVDYTSSFPGSCRIIGMGAINLDPPVAQTVLLNTATAITGSKFYSTFRILGGTAEPTVFYADSRGGATWPYTYSIPNCKIGDIVLLGLNYATLNSAASSSSATNMTIISTPVSNISIQTFAAYVTADGTFTTTINGNESQAWTQAIAVLRGNSTGVSPVTGSQTFTSNGTFTIPPYLSLTVDADSGQGGKGGQSSRETGGSCTQGTSGSAGQATTVIGSGINVATATGSGGSPGNCSAGNCVGGSVGSISNVTTIYSSGLTVGGTATVTIGNGGTGGLNSKSAPCANSSSTNAASGAKGSVTISWTE